MKRFALAFLVAAFAAGVASCRLVLPDRSDDAPADLLDKTWYWLETYDPYGGGTWYRPSANSAQHTFFFARDGHYVEDRPRGCCRRTGQWEIVDQAESLRLSPDSTPDRPLTYELRHLSPDTLRMAIMGRHGMLEFTFILFDVTLD